jgi:thiol-disulfide isomerase/thioredoxin
MNKRILFTAISMLLGILFLFSAYIKIDPIEIFEFSFIEIKLANWTTAPIIARLMLGFEFFVGILLLLNINGSNKRLAALTLATLLFFSIYLILIIIFKGNSGNCGCFGTFIKMSPLESLLKNLILISLTLILFLSQKKENVSSNKWLMLAAGIAAFTSPFIINPISAIPPPSETAINYNLKLDALFAPGKELPHIKGDIRKGKVVIAFLSLTCPHCKIGAQKLNIIHENQPEVPIFFILNGEKTDLAPFLEESKTTTIPFTFMTLKEGFLDNAGLNLPAILWVNNNRVEHKTKYTQLNEADLIAWYNQ